MKESQISDVQLLKPGEYPAIVFYLVDEAFDQMTLPVQVGIVGLGFFPVGARGNDRTHVQVQDVLTEPLGIISLVGNHVFTGITGYQPLGLGGVVLLAPVRMNRKGLPRPSTVTWTLVLNPLRLRPRA